jgi:predicted enzyme related to lactoylglutathione lyase
MTLAIAAVRVFVDDIQALHTRLAASGCTITGPPERRPWGGMLMHVADLSGNIISFVEG